MQWIFVLKYAILDWLPIIVNCYYNQNRDAIVYSLTQIGISIGGVIDDELISTGNERSKYLYYDSI